VPNSGALAEDGSRLVAFGTSSRTYDNILVNIPYYPATSIPTGSGVKNGCINILNNFYN